MHYEIKSRSGRGARFSGYYIVENDAWIIVICWDKPLISKTTPEKRHAHGWNEPRVGLFCWMNGWHVGCIKLPYMLNSWSLRELMRYTFDKLLHRKGALNTTSWSSDFETRYVAHSPFGYKYRGLQSICKKWFVETDRIDRKIIVSSMSRLFWSILLKNTIWKGKAKGRCLRIALGWGRFKGMR
jgi:hypothetical protein